MKKHTTASLKFERIKNPPKKNTYEQSLKDVDWPKEKNSSTLTADQNKR